MGAGGLFIGMGRGAPGIPGEPGGKIRAKVVLVGVPTIPRFCNFCRMACKRWLRSVFRISSCTSANRGALCGKQFC